MRPYAAKAERDYWVPLLEVLADRPEHLGEVSVVIAEFEPRFGHLLDEREREFMPAHGTARWEWRLHWSRYHLAQKGLLASPVRGVWRITDEGLEWLRRFPDATRMGAMPKARSSRPAAPGTVTLREEGSRMRPDKTLQTFEDFWVPLLEVLAEMPDHAGRARDVIEAFGARNVQRIHPQQLEFMETQGQPRWAYNLRWSRQSLLGLGLMDAPAWGVWRITEAGLAWLREHPDETHLDAKTVLERTSSVDGETETVPKRSERLSFRAAGRQLSLSADDVLQVARRHLASGLPREAQYYEKWVVTVDGQTMGLRWLFAEVTGIHDLYFAQKVLSRLGLEVARLDSKPPSPRPTPAPKVAAQNEEQTWLLVVRAEVTAIRDLLRGRGVRPTDERLCDQVQLCYLLGLYREGGELFRLVDGTRVHPWYYERTRRLAQVCDMRCAHGR